MHSLGLAAHPRPALARLDDAVASNLAAQAEVQQAGADTAEIAVQARRQAVRSRWQGRRKARELREEPMQTGSVREMVDDMMRDMARR